MDLSQFEKFLQLMRKHNVLVAKCGEMEAQLMPEPQPEVPDDRQFVDPNSPDAKIPKAYRTLKRQIGID